MEDEGVGVHFAYLLKNLLPKIEIREMGNLTFSIIVDLKGKDLVVFVDALSPDYPEDFLWTELQRGTIPIKNSLHEVGIMELIGIMELMDERPKDVFLFGIKPYSITPKMGLSLEMKEKIPSLKEIFIEKFEGLSKNPL